MKGTYLEHLSEEAIPTLVRQIPGKTSLSSVLMLRLDGAYSRVGEEETAFSGARTPRFGVFILGISPDPDVLAADRTWVRATWDARQPDAPDLGGYVNAHAEFGDRVHAIYGTEYARLAQIKASYDPDNVFHHNANITPASQ